MKHLRRKSFEKDHQRLRDNVWETRTDCYVFQQSAIFRNSVLSRRKKPPKYAIRLSSRILKGNRYHVITNLSISSRIMMLIGDLYASSKTCLIHTNIVCQQLTEHKNNIYSSLPNTDPDNVSTFCALLKTNHSFSRDLQNSESISHSEKTIVRSEDNLQRKIDTYDLNIWEVTIDTNSCS